MTRPTRPLPVLTGEIAERFWSYVDKTESCWSWTRGLTSEGYGAFGVGRGWRLVHRLAWAMQRGPIPDDLVIDHLCRNRRCVRIDHLDLVTTRENIIRGESVRPHSHCKRGHEFTEENSYRPPHGRGRICRRCAWEGRPDRKSTRLNSSHSQISYSLFCF